MAKLVHRFNLDLSELQAMALEQAKQRESVDRVRRGKTRVSKGGYARFCLELDLPVSDVEAARRQCARAIVRLKRTKRKRHALRLLCEALTELSKDDRGELPTYEELNSTN